MSQEVISNWINDYSKKPTAEQAQDIINSTLAQIMNNANQGKAFTPTSTTVGNTVVEMAKKEGDNKAIQVVQKFQADKRKEEIELKKKKLKEAGLLHCYNEQNDTIDDFCVVRAQLAKGFDPLGLLPVNPVDPTNTERQSFWNMDMSTKLIIGGVATVVLIVLLKK